MNEAQIICLITTISLFVFFMSLIIYSGTLGETITRKERKLMDEYTRKYEKEHPSLKEKLSLPIVIHSSEIEEDDEQIKIFWGNHNVLNKIQLAECQWVYTVIFTDEERLLFCQIWDRERYETIDLDTFISMYREIVETLKRGGIY